MTPGSSRATSIYVRLRGALGIRFNLGLYADLRYFDSQLGHFAEARSRVEAVASLLLTANIVKFFAGTAVRRTRRIRIRWVTA
jgi:hypothetical protein